MSNPLALTSLTQREAIADALNRCILGIDSNDRSLFESACLKNESMTVTAGPLTLSGWTSINDYFDKLFSLVTIHIISNIRIELKDDAPDTASMTAHAIGYHVRPEDAHKQEDTSYTGANLYDIGMVKDAGDGLWKIGKWDLKVLWTTGDSAILYG